MNEKNARLSLGLGIPMVLAASGILPYLAAWSTFPDRIASHFTSAGVPDGSMTPTAFLFTNAGWFLAGCILLVGVALVRRPMFPSVAMSIATAGAFLVAIPAAVLLETAVSQRGLDRWQDASSNLPLTLVSIFGLGIAAAAAAGRLVTFLPGRERTLDSDSRPVMDLAVGETAVWSATLRSTLGSVLAVASAVFGVLIGFATGQWWVAVVLLVCAALILATSNIRVRVDRDGLAVRYGFLPWPKTTIDVASIESAAVLDVRPKEWGGWGYRGSLTLMKRAAVVLRAGPGIRLDLRNDKVFVVTIDDPETAVALLNAVIQRQDPVVV